LLSKAKLKTKKIWRESNHEKKRISGRTCLEREKCGKEAYEKKTFI
jgi:hypothetical protein